MTNLITLADSGIYRALHIGLPPLYTSDTQLPFIQIVTAGHLLPQLPQLLLSPCKFGQLWTPLACVQMAYPPVTLQG